MFLDIYGEFVLIKVIVLVFSFFFICCGLLWVWFWFCIWLCNGRISRVWVLLNLVFLVGGVYVSFVLFWLFIWLNFISIFCIRLSWRFVFRVRLYWLCWGFIFCVRFRWILWVLIVVFCIRLCWIIRLWKIFIFSIWLCWIFVFSVRLYWVFIFCRLLSWFFVFWFIISFILIFWFRLWWGFVFRIRVCLFVGFRWLLIIGWLFFFGIRLWFVWVGFVLFVVFGCGGVFFVLFFRCGSLICLWFLFVFVWFICYFVILNKNWSIYKIYKK